MSFQTFDRVSLPYVNKSATFLYNGEQNYERQYFNIYRARLDKFRPILIEVAQKQFG